MHWYNSSKMHRTNALSPLFPVITVVLICKIHVVLQQTKLRGWIILLHAANSPSTKSVGPGQPT